MTAEPVEVSSHALFCHGVCRSPATCRSATYSVPATAGPEPGAVHVEVRRHDGQPAVALGGAEFTLTEAQQLVFELNRAIQISRLAVAAKDDALTAEAVTARQR